MRRRTRPTSEEVERSIITVVVMVLFYFYKIEAIRGRIMVYGMYAQLVDCMAMTLIKVTSLYLLMIIPSNIKRIGAHKPMDSSFYCIIAIITRYISHGS